MNRQGKSHDAIEERMQSASKAFWEDFLKYKSKDVQRKVQCRRVVDHVLAVLAFGSENWSWTVLTLDKIKVRDQDNVTSIPLQKTQRRNMGRLSCKDLQNGKEDMDAHGLAFSV